MQFIHEDTWVFYTVILHLLYYRGKEKESMVNST
jgi:hypothetical protein